MIKSLIYVSLFVTLLFLLVFQPPSVSAVESTPSATEATSSTLMEKLKKIEVLKDKIATKVAQLRQSEKGAQTGIVKSINGKSITLTTRSGEKTAMFSDDTVFFVLEEGNRTSTSAQKLKEGNRITVIGYFEDSGNLIAKYIYSFTPLVRISGKISNIEKSNYTITIKDAQGDTIADGETYSQIFLFDKAKGLIKGGFSKLAIGDTVHVVATPNPKEENRVSIRRLVALSFATANETPSPSSLPSNSPTPKPTSKSKTSTPSATDAKQ